MKWFSGLNFGFFNHVPQCEAWIDRVFIHYALNLAYSGEFYWGGPGQEPVRQELPLVYWTTPGMRYVYGSRESSWDQYYVTFHGPRARRWQNQALLPTSPTNSASPADAPAFRKAFEELLGELSAHYHHPQRAVHLLEGLLLSLHEQASTQPMEDPLAQRVQASIDAIHQQPAALFDIEREAQHCGCSAVHYRRKFKELTELSPTQYVIRCRLDQAAEFLRTSDLPIKELAEQCGYEDIYYFSKHFKRQFRTPPARYRRASQLKG